MKRFNPMPHVLRVQCVKWEPLTIKNGQWYYHHDVTRMKVMAIIMAFFKVRHMLDKFWPDVLCIQNCLDAALPDGEAGTRTRNQVWYADVVGNYSVALQKTSDGIYFVYGWAEDFQRFYDELSWIS